MKLKNKLATYFWNIHRRHKFTKIRKAVNINMIFKNVCANQYVYEVKIQVHCVEAYLYGMVWSIVRLESLTSRHASDRCPHPPIRLLHSSFCGKDEEEDKMIL